MHLDKRELFLAGLMCASAACGSNPAAMPEPDMGTVPDPVPDMTVPEPDAAPDA